MMLLETPLAGQHSHRGGVGRVLKPFPLCSLCRQNKASTPFLPAEQSSTKNRDIQEKTHRQLITSDLWLQKQEVVWKRRWERHRPGHPRMEPWGDSRQEGTHCGFGGFFF